MRLGAGAGLQPGTPDRRPDRAQESAAVVSLEPPRLADDVTGPDCPSCGAVMSRFPMVLYCALCEFTITGPGGRLAS